MSTLAFRLIAEVAGSISKNIENYHDLKRLHILMEVNLI